MPKNGDIVQVEFIIECRLIDESDFGFNPEKVAVFKAYELDSSGNRVGSPVMVKQAETVPGGALVRFVKLTQDERGNVIEEMKLHLEFLSS